MTLAGLWWIVLTLGVASVGFLAGRGEWWASAWQAFIWAWLILVMRRRGFFTRAQ